MLADQELKLYFDFLSQPSRALWILLKSSGTQFEAKQLNLLQGEHMSENYQRINRFRKVPAIVNGNLQLAESIAILRYLVNTNKIKQQFYPNDLQHRARIDEFIQWQHNGVRTSCSLYFRFLWVQKHVFGTPAAEGKVAKYCQLMEKDLEFMENLWLKDTKFLTGSTLTAADVFGACEVEQIRCCGYEIKNKFPRLHQWIENVREELKPYFEAAHLVVYNYEKETKAKL